MLNELGIQMKFYVASSLANYEQVRDLSLLLKKAGWEHTFDWTVYCPAQRTNAEILKTIGTKEYEGIKQADVVVVLTPQGRGTHVELGMAIALNKKIYLCHHNNTYFEYNDSTSTFYWLPQVHQFVGNTNDIASMLLKLM